MHAFPRRLNNRFPALLLLDVMDVLKGPGLIFCFMASFFDTTFGALLSFFWFFGGGLGLGRGCLRCFWSLIPFFLNRGSRGRSIPLFCAQSSPNPSDAHAMRYVSILYAPVLIALK